MYFQKVEKVFPTTKTPICEHDAKTKHHASEEKTDNAFTGSNKINRKDIINHVRTPDRRKRIVASIFQGVYQRALQFAFRKI